MDENAQLRDYICEICKLMWMQGWVAANDGNVSARLPNGDILCTPSGVSKREVTPEMLIAADAQGNAKEGNRRPSTELAMHLRCYADRPDIGAVVHAHPPFCTAFAAADIALDGCGVIETILTIGAVPVVPFAMPGTDAVADAIAPFLPRHDALLLRAHGALTAGCDLRTAYYRMESLEQFAKISLYARQLGGMKDLPKKDIDALIERRKSFYGITGKHPGFVKFNS